MPSQCDFQASFRNESSMIDDFIDTLKAMGMKPTPEEVLDMLWLAQHLDEPATDLDDGEEHDDG